MIDKKKEMNSLDGLFGLIIFSCVMLFVGAFINNSYLEYQYEKKCERVPPSHPFSTPPCRVSFENHLEYGGGIEDDGVERYLVF